MPNPTDSRSPAAPDASGLTGSAGFSPARLARVLAQRMEGPGRWGGPPGRPRLVYLCPPRLPRAVGPRYRWDLHLNLLFASSARLSPAGSSHVSGPAGWTLPVPVERDPRLPFIRSSPLAFTGASQTPWPRPVTLAPVSLLHRRDKLGGVGRWFPHSGYKLKVHGVFLTLH